MTLACECGGVLQIESQSYGDEMAFESFKCASCGDTGTMVHDKTGTRLSGCVTRQ